MEATAKLPEGYFLRESGASKVLLEEAPVYRPVANGSPESLASPERRVARFPGGTPLRTIYEVARLDDLSRTHSSGQAVRHLARLQLAETFSGGASL